jgi:hypothetical protein
LLPKVENRNSMLVTAQMTIHEREACEVQSFLGFPEYQTRDSGSRRLGAMPCW